MRKARFTDEQIVRIVQEVDGDAIARSLNGMASERPLYV